MVESGDGEGRSEMAYPNDAPTITGSRLGVIIGSSLSADELLADHLTATRREIDTAWGSAGVLDVDDFVLLRRHGLDTFTPAHRVNHRANLAALCAAGCDRVVALASVGGLRGWPVGTVVAPFDFLAPQVNPSFFTDERGHSVPGYDGAWRDTVLDTWGSLSDTPIMDGAVYAQTHGPRFETPAEVRVLATHADIVGMTVADECILAREAGLAYMVIATIDNLANGVAGTALTVDEFHDGVASNLGRLVNDLRAVLPSLAATPRPS